MANQALQQPVQTEDAVTTIPDQAQNFAFTQAYNISREKVGKMQHMLGGYFMGDYLIYFLLSRK